MVKNLNKLTFALATVVFLGAGDLRAQTPAQKPEPAQASQAKESDARERRLPVQVHVVISRLQGQKKLSSVPYAIAVNAGWLSAGGRSQLRVGARVPYTATVFGPGDGGKQPTRSYSYEQVGTSIDCSVAQYEGGLFSVFVTVADTSVDVGSPTGQGAAQAVNDVPIFRNFTSTNELTLRDGQSAQFTAATDRVSGEVTRVDVTLNVVK
jgi:hypothetical protein